MRRFERFMDLRAIANLDLQNFSAFSWREGAIAKEEYFATPR